MKNLRVAAITGELCMCHEEGQALLKVLQPALKAGKVSLDFSETRLHMPPFFNSGIVPLLLQYSLSDLKSCLVISNLPAHSTETLDRCLENGNSYYCDPLCRKAVNLVFDQQGAAV